MKYTKWFSTKMGLLRIKIKTMKLQVEIKGIDWIDEVAKEAEGQRDRSLLLRCKISGSDELNGEVSNYISDAIYSVGQNRSQKILVEKCKLNEKINVKINENLGQ